MGLERKAVSFVPASSVGLLLIASLPLISSLQAGESATYERAPAEARRRHPGVSLPKDDTPKYLVKAVEVAGNALLSAQDLLSGVPVLYVVKNKDPSVPPEVYDFRVLQDVIRAPGELRQVSTRTIKGFTEFLLSRYKDRGYAGIYVYVSARAVRAEDASVADIRRLQDDLLSLRVIEGKVASVVMKHYDAEGNKKETGFLKDSVVEAWSPAKPGGGIREKPLDDFVRLLNENPDRYVRHTVSSSSEPNSLDLTYAIYEESPWHPYVQLDSSGTDERQWSPRIGLLNTNLTGRDDRASIMYQADVDDPTENYAAFGSYGLPIITPRLRLGVFGGYSEFDITPEATGGLTSFLGAGSFYGGNLRYNVVQAHDWFLDLTGSLSAENSKIDSDLGVSSDIDMRLLGLGFEIHRSDTMSDTSAVLDCIQCLGGSDSEDFEEARTGAERDFVKYSLVASHKQYLDEAKLNHIGGSFRYILSDDRLVPAKMTTFGGLYSVRGYPEDALVADGGILASLEYRRCLVRGLGAEEAKKGGKISRMIQPVDVSVLGFTDYGRTKVEDPVAGEKKAQDLWGVGLGTLITAGEHFEARIYYGWVLEEIERPSDGRTLADEGDGAWHFSFLYRW